jgi:hypothetical protein
MLCFRARTHVFLEYNELSLLYIVHQFGKSYKAIPSADRCARA